MCTRRLLLLFLWTMEQSTERAFAKRSWTDFMLNNDLTTTTQQQEFEDPIKHHLYLERDRSKLTSEPSVAPSSLPSVPLTNHPSPPPSSHPSSLPTLTNAPTPRRDASFFSYNPYSKYGPDKWGKVQRGDDFFFDKFINIDENECTWHHNSPIDLRSIGDECLDDHQIHTERGRNDWDSVQFQVLPHSLRATFELNDTPARADFSNLSPFVPAYYLDLKIPSEHTMEGGKQNYLGEIHIGHKFEEKNVNIGMFLDPTLDVFNPRIEEFIREWEEVLWERQHNCRYRESIVKPPNYSRTHPIRNKEEMRRIWIPEPDKGGGDANWDLYQIQPTVWYYGYNGSFTVPPCTEHVFWRFLDLPASISWSQYRRIQHLILNQMDKESCLPIRGVAYNGGVNRPIQKNNYKTYRCKNWKIRYRDDWYNMWPEGYHGNDKLYKK